MAAANFTDAVRQGIVPASWIAVDGNRTYIACDVSLGAVESYYQCAERLGHTRGGNCAADKSVANVSGVCHCSAFAGWVKTCAEARCTYGTVDGCAVVIPELYLNVVLLGCSLLLVTGIFLYALSTVWQGRAACGRDVMSTTLAWATLTALSSLLWFGTSFVSGVISRTAEPMVRDGGRESVCFVFHPQTF